jgi:hypothetical protein
MEKEKEKEKEKDFYCITSHDDVDIIDLLLEESDGDGECESMGGLEVVRLVEDEKREKGEKCEKEIDNSKLMQCNEKEKTHETKYKIQSLEIKLLINTTTCDEVIFKKHVVEIIDKMTQMCVMCGVVVRYEFDGRVWDPDIVLVFEDGRRFYNENFGYMFRYYL